MDAELFKTLQDFAKSREVSYNGQGPTSRESHLVLGVVSEAGELADAYKKLFYGKDLDWTNVSEEVFDILFYLALLLDEIDVPIETVIERGIAKLEKRYPAGFDADRSQNRDLAAERKALEGEATLSLFELEKNRADIHAEINRLVNQIVELGDQLERVTEEINAKRRNTGEGH